MDTFENRYGKLNAAQKQAVDTIDGPVMVIAGPGTGKTELLSMRVANILKRTDELPQNILCLTYTESGAHAMRERLAGLIGADAYKVAIHTFHSFGSEIINHNGEYFYHGAHFRPADQLSGYEVLRTIFDGLPHDSQLASTMNGDYTYLRDTQTAISDLKKSGLTSDELLAVLDRNDRFSQWLQPRLDAVMAPRMSKKVLEAVESLCNDIATYQEDPYELITYEPLHELTGATLCQALEDARESDSTKPLSAWKRSWCEKQADGQLTLKDVKRSQRLRAVAGIYYSYLVEMQRRALYDFDDMILRTVHALEVFEELRLNLQEQYHYILVDEFQDTNDAQMRLLWNLTNNEASAGRPNVMVVGDDDQAIYRFQGAKLSNILDYQGLYRDVVVVTLRDNYRSAAAILSVARDTIVQANERLERTLASVDKTLNARHDPPHATLDYVSFPDEATEYSAVARRLAEIRRREPTATVAVIARRHRLLQTMVPYLQQQHVSLSYDRRDNALDSPPIVFLEHVARVVTLLAEQQLDDANAALPELLAHPAWGIEARELWQTSLTAFTSRQLWLETMLTRGDTMASIAQWLLSCATMSLHEPLEYVIDQLTGTDAQQAADDASDASDEDTDSSNTAAESLFHSPLKAYFFDTKRLMTSPTSYIAYLDALTSIRHSIRDYRPEGRLLLRDFIHFVDQYRQLGLTIQTATRTVAEQQPVELLTAHRAKGLEFDHVFVVGLSDTAWGETARSRGSLISYPHNLPIGSGGDSSDEHIRLLFVALTRAKSHLHLSLHRATPTGALLHPVGYLSHVARTEAEDSSPALETQDRAWHAGLAAIPEHDQAALLRPILTTYRLSATHLCNYLDVPRGGPERFLRQNLLRFPQAMSPSAAFGSAVHTTLQRAHVHLAAMGKKRPIEDLLGDFETVLGDYQLANDTYEHFAKKGTDVLSTYLAARYDSFAPEQQAEQRFTADGLPDGVRLSGAIDMMEVHEDTKTIVVTDYKTGKSTVSWRGRTEYEKMKLHHYRQQLLFYKLLIENSRQYKGYSVERGVIEFIEANPHGTIDRLELAYDGDEVDAFTKLVRGVWRRIQTLQFSTPEPAGARLADILEFEDIVRG